jgi:hypothetical protein
LVEADEALRLEEAAERAKAERKTDGKDEPQTGG